MRELLWIWASFAFAASAAAQAPAEGAEVAQLVIDVSAAGEAHGERVGDVHSGTLRAGARRAFSARLAAGECYLFAARGGSGIEDLDLSVSRGRTALTRDTATGASAEARHCAGERPERVRYTVRAFRGAGAFAAALYRVSADDEEGAEAPASHVSVLEGLEAMSRAHGEGMAVVTPPRREELTEGARIERPVTLAPGRCYRVLVAGEPGIADLDVALLGPDGGVLQSDVGEESSAHLGVLRPICPARPGEHRVALRAERGNGAVAWQVLGSTPRERVSAPSSSEASRFRVGGTGSGFVASRIRARHGAVGRGRAPVTDLITGSLRTSEARSIPLEVDGGRCYVVLGAGVPSVRELDLRVVDPYGNERARDQSRDAFPATGSFCPSVGGRWTVEVRMFNGYGQFGVQIYAGAR